LEMSSNSDRNWILPHPPRLNMDMDMGRHISGVQDGAGELRLR